MHQFDVHDELMYWTAFGTNCIYRAGLDGSDRITLVYNYNHPCGLSLVLA